MSDILFRIRYEITTSPWALWWVPFWIAMADVLTRPRRRFPIGGRLRWAIVLIFPVALGFSFPTTRTEIPLEVILPAVTGSIYLVLVRLRGGPVRPGGVLDRWGPLAWLRALSRPIAALFRDLSLFWKIVSSSLVLLVVLSAIGGVVVVRELSRQARDALTDDLERHVEPADDILDEASAELYDASAVAAQRADLAAATWAKDGPRAGESLYRVISRRKEIDFIGVTDRSGRKIFHLTRSGVGVGVRRLLPALGVRSFYETEVWKTHYATIGDTAVAVSIEVLEHRGREVGMVVAATSLENVLRRVAKRVSAGVALYDLNGRRLAAADHPGRPGVRPPPELPFEVPDADACGVERDVPDRFDCLYESPLVLSRVMETPIPASRERAFTLFRNGRFLLSKAGPASEPRAIAFTIPSAPTIAAANGARRRLVVLLGALTVGLVMVGGVVARLILRQVRPLREASRALAAGDLSARATVLARDELGELAGSFNRMADRLQDSVEGRTQFFTSMSHELRTPLFAIIGHADMMIDPKIPLTGDWRAEFGGTIRQSGEHILRLINDILELAKFESGAMELTRSPIDLASAGEELRQTVLPLTAQAGLDLEIEIPPDLRVSADPTRLRQILFNLASNAIKYTPRGGRVQVSAARSGATVEITVSDTGLGIPPEARELIFEPFYQVPGTTPLTGQASSGLGLALTRQLVEAHGGTITLESWPGVGTVFRVALPVP